MAFTYPLEIVQADRWVNQNKNLKGDALAKAFEAQPWDPSAIVLLTSVIHLACYQADSALPKVQDARSPGYPVMLGHQTLFCVRDVKGYPGEERARTIAERVKRIAEKPGIPVTSVAASQYHRPITLVETGEKGTAPIVTVPTG